MGVVAVGHDLIKGDRENTRDGVRRGVGGLEMTRVGIVQGWWWCIGWILADKNGFNDNVFHVRSLGFVVLVHVGCVFLLPTNDGVIVHGD